MVFSICSQVSYTVASLGDEYSGGKVKKEYCKKGDTLFVISDKGNVLIVYGKNGRFPILKSNVKEIMIQSPEELINRIKEVDLKMSYGFPIEFVLGITENKPWESEFVEKLRKSDVRASLKKEILERYESDSIK